MSSPAPAAISTARRSRSGTRGTRGDFTIDLFEGDRFFIHARQAEVLGVLDAALSRRMNGGPAALSRTGGPPAGRTLQ